MKPVLTLVPDTEAAPVTGPKRTYTKEQRKKWRQKQKDRYASDPEFKAKILTQAKAWREAHPELKRQRAREWSKKQRDELRVSDPEAYRRFIRGMNLRKYGLSAEDYERMLVAQNGVCAICRKHCKSGKRLAVDHDQDTDKVRGLLCASCNCGLGMYQSDPLLMRTAAEYLERNK
jgi:Recombination endonuclease VII